MYVLHHPESDSVWLSETYTTADAEKGVEDMSWLIMVEYIGRWPFDKNGDLPNLLKLLQVAIRLNIEARNG